MAIGTLYIVSAPSGAGKTSLLKALLVDDERLSVSVSYTTRPMRAGETDGEDYHFVDQNRFMEMVKQGEFLEHAQVFDNYYGSCESVIKEQLEKGIDLLLEIDWQGARQVRKKIPEAVSIFILPPTQECLLERLNERGQDSQEVVERRMQQAKDEISHYPEYDYLVVNDRFSEALDSLRAIVAARRLRCESQVIQLEHDLSRLLA